MFSNLVIANFKTDPDKKGNVKWIPYVTSPDKIPGATYTRNKQYGLNPKLIIAVLDYAGVGPNNLRDLCQKAIDQANLLNNPEQVKDPDAVYPVALDGAVVGNMTLTEAKKVCSVDHYIFIDGAWKPAAGVLGLKPTLPPPPQAKRVVAEVVDEDDDEDDEDDTDVFDDELDGADSVVAKTLQRIKG